MATDVLTAVSNTSSIAPPAVRSLGILVPIGRVLFAAIFIIASFGHFSSTTIGYAASNGVPGASLLVPLSGILALVGGLMVALGYKTRIGALMLVVFLVPVTLMMHNFWAVGDPMMAQMQRAMFMKNLAMLGGTLLLMYFGGGPFSLDTRSNAADTIPPAPKMPNI